MNKKSIVFLLLFFAFVSFQTKAQTPGQWVWQSGNNSTNSPGVFGALGVASPGNTPPALYESCSWTDASGNFWLFGGGQSGGTIYNTMWKFDITSKQWAWMAGQNTPFGQATYGTQGVPAPGNVPGSRGYGMLSWTDLNGNFWLYGGYGYDATGITGYLGDLWKFNPTTLQWTWMSGSMYGSMSGNYGTLGVPSPTNAPASTGEAHLCWTDASNNLWFFGGYASGVGGMISDNLWKYNIATGIWTWVQGSGSGSTSANYGALGVESTAYTPGSRTGYTSFIDPVGHLWLFGATIALSTYTNDVWRYNTTTGGWAYYGGTTSVNDPGQYNLRCDTVTTNIPAAAMEIRASWADSCGFWFYGGYIDPYSFDNLWYYNCDDKKFTWVSGTNVPNASGSYGTKGVSAATNIPPARNGAVTWKDHNGNLWMFGGEQDFGLSICFNDLWMYRPDTNCVHLCTTSTKNPEPNPPPVICEKLLIPNVFSPNGDRENDLFNVTALCFKSYEIKIFDRWGVNVFESTDPTTPWNGNKNLVGKACSEGTYYYLITTVNSKNVENINRGFLTLLR